MSEKTDPQQRKLRDLLSKGVGAWNLWRTQYPQVRPDLRQAVFDNEPLNGVNFSGAYLNGVNLSLQRLDRANLAGANLAGTNLTGTKLEGTNLNNAIITDADLTDAELGGATLQGADLKGSILRMTNLKNAVLSHADLSGTNLSYADLTSAKLDGAHLNDSDLVDANLSFANLIRADLGGARLCGADLSKANLNLARLSSTVFGNTKLKGALGLDNCDHRGPSYLDFFTLAQSGRLPLIFLRGCGLPEILIEYLPSLLSEGIQFYSCFISYFTKDEEFAERLHADLQDRGIRCWFAPHQIQGGKKLYKQIDEAIRAYDRLLLILTPYSMNSEWVKTEISKARKREIQEKRTVLFPVRLVDFDTLKDWECFDSDTGKDSAREIREFYVPDFSNWKNHDAYQAEFEKLVRDLKAEHKSAVPA